MSARGRGVAEACTPPPFALASDATVAAAGAAIYGAAVSESAAEKLGAGGVLARERGRGSAAHPSFARELSRVAHALEAQHLQRPAQHPLSL